MTSATQRAKEDAVIGGHIAFYVSPSQSGWRFYGEIPGMESKTFLQKRDAVIYGQEIAKQHGPSVLVIQ